MRSQNRHICLLIDNFLGHFVSYKLQNIQLEYFKPNLMSFIQSLDAGIIRCFKAYYQRFFCSRALDLDEAGEADIYKLNLLEGILMVKRAWNEVDNLTLKHCWEHTMIQEASTLHDSSYPTRALSDPT